MSLSLVACMHHASPPAAHVELLLPLLVLSRARPELMEACAAWARGQRFADVLNLAPDVFEGSLVRAVRRLEELMRQVRQEGGGGEIVPFVLLPPSRIHSAGLVCKPSRRATRCPRLMFEKQQGCNSSWPCV
jgi:hypothetical protein